MRSVLEALYNGDIQVTSRSYEPDSPFERLTKLKERNLNDLMKLLNDSGKEVFEKYRGTQDEIDVITHYDTYSYALKLGILLMVEVFMNSGDVIGTDYVAL